MSSTFTVPDNLDLLCRRQRLMGVGCDYLRSFPSIETGAPRFAARGNSLARDTLRRRFEL